MSGLIFLAAGPNRAPNQDFLFGSGKDFDLKLCANRVVTKSGRYIE